MKTDATRLHELAADDGFWENQSFKAIQVTTLYFEARVKPTEQKQLEVDLAGLADEALVERLKAGDRDSYKELLRRYRGAVLSYLFRMTGDRGWAEDLAQETFLRVFRSLPGFKSESRFTTWLYRIAHNLAVDFLKRRRLEPRLLDEGDNLGPGLPSKPGSTDPVRQAERGELRAQVLKSVRDLGPKFRDVFVLCAMQDLSYEEAGEILGLSPKTVSSRLCRARKKFKAGMAAYVGARPAPTGD